ncbi:IS3 family transposase [Zunongwangia sp. HGR-M22]|uniref:IS3 family transposase n=1 Tax=Zunongwangia sp. HGR-M22 TaxID=3015168 RepID=UPI0022DD3FD5|nr:IS3 family transposase [Zunongwangia sp. HGR-M22]WBL24252.1 IS3 family transposase [Zunongwangia sp. HGR-M22]
MQVVNLAIMRRKAKHYTLEFKQKAVELSYAKGSVVQVCEDLDILPAVLYRWRKEQKNYGKNSFPGRGNPKMTDEQKEIARLRKQLKETELERDNLKKGDWHLFRERQEKYRFIKQHRMKFPARKMCTMLAVSKSGYYHWLKSGPSNLWKDNQKLSSLIKDIFEDSYQSYGAPRIKAELEALGFKVSKPRIARIMKANYLYAKRKRKFKTTTNSNHKYPTAPNLLNQCFNVARANQVWVSDITYVQTKQGWSYLTVIIDLFNRKVIGWALSDTLNTEDTIIKAWQMAIKNTTLTQPLIFHSDQGIQYASQRFTNLLKSYNGLVKQSMSRKGNCWDNAVAESFFKSLKVEWVYWHKYKLRSQAELSIFQWIETWYNTRRRHSYLGNRTIKEFEIDMYNQKLAA